MHIYVHMSLRTYQLYNICGVMWSILLYLDTIQPIYSHSEAYADHIHTIISSQ